jgi:hypothetical protein
MFQEVCRQDNNVLGLREGCAVFLMCQVYDAVDYEPCISTSGPVYLEWRHIMVLEGVEPQACHVSVDC